MALVLGLALFLGAGLRAADIWVSPDGSDANPGTQASPLASVALAQRKARELRRLRDPAAADGVRIILRGGVYFLEQPLIFRPADSGTAASPTIIEAAPGERPVLSGGVRVTGWHELRENVPELPAAARGKIWVADAPRLNGRMVEFRQLWVGGRKAVRAREPADGAMARLLGWEPGRREAVIPAAAVAAVKNPAGLEMFLQQQWEIAVLRVKTLRVAGGKAFVTFQQPESRIEFEHPWPQPILPPAGGGAFFLANVIGFLDRPGEWYQEMPGGRVFYWPRAGEDLARTPVVAPALPTLVRVAGTLDRPVAYVRFQGIGFAHATWLRPSLAGHVPLQEGMDLIDAYKLTPPGTPEKADLENQAWIARMPAGVKVSGANHIVFERCRFEHMAASGLDFARGTRDSVIEGCIFRDLGGNGIQLGSFRADGVETHVPYAPADEREVCARVRIADNLVTDCATEDWGCVGIGVGYAREIDIAHNDVCDLPYTGISVGWGWTAAPNCMRDNRIFANRVHRVATRLCDTAGIYTLSAQPGTVISENRVDGIVMSPYADLPGHWFYLYLDEGSSGITVRDNWCPAERFLKNANGPGNVWMDNGPQVSARIKNAAGLEPAFHDLLTEAKRER